MERSSLRIALVAPPWYAVPPHGYGGIELVVSLLHRELRRRGHRVTLIASEGSPGAVVAAPAGWHPDLGSPDQSVRESTYAWTVAQLLRRMGPFDLVHDHAGAVSLVTLAGMGTPLLHTVHSAVAPAARELYNRVGHAAELVAISESQRRSAPSLNWFGTVYNAVDLDSLEVGSRAHREPYLLCLARICHEKGQHLAIEVARRLGMRLVLAGKVEPTRTGSAYFEEAVLPHVDGHAVVHIHNAVGTEKTRLLAHAAALLAPLQWDEPFGLAIVEAMASGTPAVATRRGATTELIEDGVTGFLCDSVDQMVEAVPRARRIDPQSCANLARARFSAAAMTDGYLEVYERVASAFSAVA